MAPDAATYLRTHRLTVISTAAVVGAAALAYLQLRKAPAPIVIAGSASTGTPDLSAFTAGAAAAGSGFDTGAAMGQSALGLAGDVVASQAGVASTLAQSQAQVAADASANLAGALGTALGTISYGTVPGQLPFGTLPPDAGNPPPGAVVPPPVVTTTTTVVSTVPTSTSTYPSTLGTPPSAAVGWIVASGITRLFTVSGNVATMHPYNTLRFSAWAGPSAHYSPNATLRKLLSGAHSGMYVASADVAFHSR